MPDTGKKIRNLLRKSISQAGDHQDPVPVMLGSGQDMPSARKSRKKSKKRKP